MLSRVLEELCQRKMKALFEIYPEFAVGSENGRSPDGISAGYGKLSKLVNNYLEKQNDNFTIQDVAKWISEIDPVFGGGLGRTSIYNALSRLVRKGKLEKLPDGAYRKK